MTDDTLITHDIQQTPPQENTSSNLLYHLLLRKAQLQRQSVDRLALREAVSAAAEQVKPRRQIAVVINHLRLKPAKWLKSPDPAGLPLLVHHKDSGWLLLKAMNAKGEWVAERWDETAQVLKEEILSHKFGMRYASLALASPYSTARSPVGRMIIDEMRARKAILAEAFIGGALIAVISLVVSLYSMQIYDRVIPTAGMQTLLVLTLGIFMALGFEFMAKRLRSRLYDRLIDEIDSQLARVVFLRFLSVRLDQLPNSVGTLAGQLKGYETVRSFIVHFTTQFLVDAPFAFLFLSVMWLLAGPIAVIPLVFLFVSVLVGIWHKNVIMEMMKKSNAIANMKTGLLVETVEGAEIIKSGQGGWRMLGRWLQSSDEGRVHELASRRITERAQHVAASFQQISYISVVAVGALLVTEGELSFGGLIACSILSGRVLGPIAQISGQLVQWGHAKAALKGLDAIWALQGDDHGVDVPLLPERLKGNFYAEDAQYETNDKTLLTLTNLKIHGGEKIAVLGPIGAGKTTLLRMLSGMYKPQVGRILLDDVDISHISKPWLAEHIGYLPQDGRLFAGTLRENLLLGLPDPGDTKILEAARETGMLNSVITPHPQGLMQKIFEGGSGLSGGQRQLVNLTRIFLRNPLIWLLDEPTASLDRSTEVSVIQALKNTLQAKDTLILVTHKPELLSLVNRVIIVSGGRVVMDGPTDAVLQKLQGKS